LTYLDNYLIFNSSSN